MVLQEHSRFWTDIFGINDFFQSPFFMFGVQVISPSFKAGSFKEYLEQRKVEVTTLDYLDTKADIIHDMNNPWNQHTNHLIGKFKVVCDIGCLEHVFDTAQCLKNCFSLVEVGGLYVLHTPVSGYVKHGLHIFNHLMLRWVVENNGFEIKYLNYSDQQGNQVSAPVRGTMSETIMWMVAKKVKEVPFAVPMQKSQNEIIKA